MLSRKNKSRLKRNRRWVRYKNFKKAIRTIVQYIVLIAVVYSILNALVTFTKYTSPHESDWTNYEGFIAISYFGIARSTTGDHISQKELEAQLRVLKELGYVTITQQDIINFYTLNKPLPEKAMYLAFEDGRNDSALFSNRILQELNYKATMHTYASKLKNTEGKFLEPNMLINMMEDGYWELGTNGYRLAYINIINKEKQYYELLSQEEFYKVKEPVSYDHYLMDFIRDENNIPIEDSLQMSDRINTDYDNVREIYTKELGFVPQTYMIMHADKLYYTMNPLVEEINDSRIRELFSLHFNREGNMLNTINMDKFDLSRVQPAPYWRTNHFLMKLELDTGKKVHFVTGDKEEVENWTVEDGVLEHDNEEIVLTTRPGKKGKMKIKDFAMTNSFTLEVTLGGHTSGIQYLELGQSVDQSLQLRLRLDGKYIYVEEVDVNGTVNRLLAIKGKNEEIADIPITLKVKDQKLSLKIRHKTVMQDEPIDERITDWNLIFSAESLREENRWEDEGNFIYDGIFKSIKISSINELGEEIIFSNRLKGFNKLVFNTVQLYNAAIDWAIKTF